MSIQRVSPGEYLSQASIHNGIAYISGMTAGDKTKDIAAQTEEVLAKIDERLAKCGTDKTKILMATIYLTDMSNKTAMNKVYIDWLGDMEPPSRACVGTDLGPGVLVEIVVNAAI